MKTGKIYTTNSNVLEHSADLIEYVKILEDAFYELNNDTVYWYRAIKSIGDYSGYVWESYFKDYHLRGSYTMACFETDVMRPNNFLAMSFQDSIEYCNSKVMEPDPYEVRTPHRIHLSFEMISGDYYTQRILDAVESILGILFSKRGEKRYEAWENLFSVVARIKGDLFNIIRKDLKLFRGYLYYHILHKCVNVYSPDCEIGKFISNTGILTCLRLCDEIDTKDLVYTWDTIQMEEFNAIPFEKKIFIVLLLAGRRISGKYYSDRIIANLTGKVDMDLLNEVLGHCADKEKERVEAQQEEANDRRSFIRCAITSQLIV